MRLCPNCSADVFPGADDCARCGAVLLADGRFEPPKRRELSALAQLTTAQAMSLLALFVASVLLSVLLWVMAVPAPATSRVTFSSSLGAFLSATLQWSFSLSAVSALAGGREPRSP